MSEVECSLKTCCSSRNDYFKIGLLGFGFKSMFSILESIERLTQIPRGFLQRNIRSLPNSWNVVVSHAYYCLEFLERTMVLEYSSIAHSANNNGTR